MPIEHLLLIPRRAAGAEAKPAAVAERIELFHIAHRQAGLGLDPGPQSDFEGPVRERVEWSERQSRARSRAGAARYEDRGLVAIKRHDGGRQPDLDRRQRRREL